MSRLMGEVNEYRQGYMLTNEQAEAIQRLWELAERVPDPHPNYNAWERDHDTDCLLYDEIHPVVERLRPLCGDAE